jgi:phage shock protein PspC (stress-responsive transcriptional regulator)
MEAQVNQVALPLRSHTILGVCEGIGEDFGFSPMFLRVPLAASVLYNPMYAVGAYLALGLVVLVSRLLFPKPKAERVDAPVIKEETTTVIHEEPELAKAA